MCVASRILTTFALQITASWSFNSGGVPVGVHRPNAVRCQWHNSKEDMRNNQIHLFLSAGFFSIQLECLVPTLKGMVAQLHPPYEQEGSNSCERSNSSKLESIVPGSDQFRACDRHPSRSNKHPQTF